MSVLKLHYPFCLSHNIYNEGSIYLLKLYLFYLFLSLSFHVLKKNPMLSIVSKLEIKKHTYMFGMGLSCEILPSWRWDNGLNRHPIVLFCSVLFCSFGSSDSGRSTATANLSDPTIPFLEVGRDHISRQLKDF